jgi:hypothetical protein
LLPRSASQICTAARSVKGTAVLDCALAVGDESDGAEAANVVSASGWAQARGSGSVTGFCLAAAGAAEPVPCSAQ